MGITPHGFPARVHGLLNELKKQTLQTLLKKLCLSELLILLILMLIGAFPAWPHGKGWGYGPSGGLGLVVVVILLILVLLGRI
jgi:hypothetical protein